MAIHGSTDFFLPTPSVTAMNPAGAPCVLVGVQTGIYAEGTPLRQLSTIQEVQLE